MTNIEKLTGAELERALETIATNAIIAAQIVFGRGSSPWLYSDTQRREMIAKILHLHEVEAEAAVGDHYNLVAAVQAKPNPALDTVGTGLERALGLVNEIDGDTAVKATAPKKANAA